MAHACVIRQDIQSITVMFNIDISQSMGPELVLLIIVIIIIIIIMPQDPHAPLPRIARSKSTKS